MLRRHNTEFEDAFRQKLENMTEQPPAGGWKTVSSLLPKRHTYWKRYAFTAFLLLLLSGSGIIINDLYTKVNDLEEQLISLKNNEKGEGKSAENRTGSESNEKTSRLSLGRTSESNISELPTEKESETKSHDVNSFNDNDFSSSGNKSSTAKVAQSFEADDAFHTGHSELSARSVNNLSDQEEEIADDQKFFPGLDERDIKKGINKSSENISSMDPEGENLTQYEIYISGAVTGGRIMPNLTDIYKVNKVSVPASAASSYQLSAGGSIIQSVSDNIKLKGSAGISFLKQSFFYKGTSNEIEGYEVNRENNNYKVNTVYKTYDFETRVAGIYFKPSTGIIYSFPGNNSWELQSEISANFLLSEEVTHSVDGEIRKPENVLVPVAGELHLSLKYRYSLSEKIKLLAGPSFSYYLNPVYNDNMPIIVQPYTFGIQSNLRF